VWVAQTWSRSMYASGRGRCVSRLPSAAKWRSWRKLPTRIGTLARRLCETSKCVRFRNLRNQGGIRNYGRKGWVQESTEPIEVQETVELRGFSKKLSMN